MPVAVHAIVVVEKVALGQVFIQVFWFSPASNIPLLFLIRSCIVHELVNGPINDHSSTETHSFALVIIIKL